MNNNNINNGLNEKPQSTDYLDNVPLDELRANMVEEIIKDCPDYDDDNDPSDANNPNKEGFYYTGAPVYSYRELLRSARENYKVKGFWFDVNTFENLIDCYTPKDTIPIILRCKHADLDRFCQVVYGMKFNETYTVLIGITDMFMRKAIKGHSNNGNPTAMKIAAEHFMDLREQEQKDGINITIFNDLTSSNEEEGE